MPTAEPKPERPCEFPYVDDATLVDMSGAQALSQHELWENIGNAQLGRLSAWMLSEANRLAEERTSPRDAALYMAGYVITALDRQRQRDIAAKELQELLGPLTTHTLGQIPANNA